MMGEYTVRAVYSAQTIRVYQAYRPEIALAALEAGRFVPPFDMQRMTWIKPSFNWMMYRSGFATKPGQEFVLGIDITRKGFEWALEQAVLSHFVPQIHSSTTEWKKLVEQKPVRVQWDPERDWRLNRIEGVRTIQIGLSGNAVSRYVNEWIVRIEDVTDVARAIDADLNRGITPARLPDRLEAVYPITEALQRELCPE